jgi:MFS family permease
VSPHRWWVLLSFSWLALWQSAVWNAFGPVDAALRYAYGWSDATVAVMADWGTVVFLVAVAPLTWLLQRHGLRCATLVAATVVALGSGMHAVTTEPAAFTALAHVGAILNGVAGVTVMSVPTALSAETVFDYISIPSTSRPITSLGVAKECLLPANNGEGEAVSVQILKREQRCELHVIQL